MTTLVAPCPPSGTTTCGADKLDPVTLQATRIDILRNGVHRWEIAEISEELRPAFEHTWFPGPPKVRQEKYSERQAVAKFKKAKGLK